MGVCTVSATPSTGMREEVLAEHHHAVESTGAMHSGAFLIAVPLQPYPLLDWRPPVRDAGPARDGLPVTPVTGAR